MNFLRTFQDLVCSRRHILDVDVRFIWNGLKVLKKLSFEEPPYFGDGLVGAHITMMMEAVGIELDVQDIVGMDVNFETFKIVKPAAVGSWEKGGVSGDSQSRQA